jgi:hypothetical protein
MESYCYAPIAFYDGRVLKCQGIATANNCPWLVAKFPGCIFLEGYQGDRIDATTFAEYHGA